jgi:N6-adenosine-specific RNA methylase IME4
MSTSVILPSAPKALAHLDRLEIEIRNAPSFAKVEALRREAKGYAENFKPVKAVADRAGEVWMRAEMKVDAEYRKIGKAKGTRGQICKGGGRGGKPVIGTAAPDAPIIPSQRELGLNRKVVKRGEKLNGLGDAKIKQITQQLKDHGKPVTPNSVLATARQEVKNQKKQTAMEAVFSAEGPFDVVVIDPPWEVQKIDRDERPNQAEFDYPTMTIDQLAAFWPATIAERIKDDCHLFCWTTQKYLPAALDLIQRWGFRYVLTMVWHKPGGFQPIDLPQYNCEFAIYARKGSPIFIDTKDFNVCNSWPRQEHSRKPKEFYDLIRRVTGGSRLDVFAREAHEGFAQYGNEIDKFEDAAE